MNYTNKKAYVYKHSIVGTRKSGLLLIRGVNMNMGEARIPIKIAEVRVFRQPLEHLINKGQMVVVLHGGCKSKSFAPMSFGYCWTKQ